MPYNCGAHLTKKIERKIARWINLTAMVAFLGVVYESFNHRVEFILSRIDNFSQFTGDQFEYVRITKPATIPPLTQHRRRDIRR